MSHDVDSPAPPRATRQHRALLAVAALNVLAMVDGVYLTLVHIDLEVGARGLGAICHALARQGCAITGGPYGAFFGVPTALVGFAGAAATLVLSLSTFRCAPALRRPWLLGLLALSGVSVVSSIGMALVSVMARSYCPFCVLWYGLNFAVAAAAMVAWGARTQFGPAVLDDHAAKPERAGVATLVEPPTLPRVALRASVTFMVSLAAGHIAYGAALAPRMAERAAQVARDIRKLKTETPVTIRVNGVVLKPTAEVNLILFSDFECPHCRKLWKRLGELPGLTERKLQVTHLHFPLDPACHKKIGYALHKHACAAAWAAECARDAGQFQAYASLLFDQQHALENDDLRSYAQAVGMALGAFDSCMASTAVRKRVADHLQAGFDAKVRGTPMLFVNGFSFPVNLPAPLLVGAIEVLLAK